MIRENRFLISRKPYAIDLSTVRGNQNPRGDLFTFSGSAEALWFRRHARTTRACIGTLQLWSHYLTKPLDLDDPQQILTADLDGRYGGDCEGRWDGSSYWGNVTLEQQERHLAVLRPMLASYPDLPEGYSGWWTFNSGKRN